MKKFLLSLIFIPKFAFAVPLPQMATAIIGISEFVFIFLTVLAIYLPFMRKFSSKNVIVYILLLFSLLFNYYLLNPSLNDNNIKENRPGMLWTEDERNKDKNSISEEEAYQLLKNNNQEYIFADVRNTAEKELGSAEGFQQVKWVDLAKNKEELNNKTIIATCWTGMRGSEICSKLRALGINCRYLRGGLKRWTELGLPTYINGPKENFGSIPYFTNVEKYLTPEETKKYINNKILIVDGRSDEEFKKVHLKNAFNIPFLDLSDDELTYKIGSLPNSRDGVIVSCFGLLSCSEAQSLGWELNRLGFKYLGAYGGGIDLLKDNKSLIETINISIQNNIKKGFNHYPKLYLFLFLIVLLNLWILIKKSTIKSFEKEKNQIKNLMLKLKPTILTIFYYFIVFNIAEIFIVESKYFSIIQLFGSLIVGFSMFKLFKLNTKILLLVSIVLSYLLILTMKPALVLILGVIILIELLIFTFIKLIKNLLLMIKKRSNFINLIDVEKFFGEETKAGKLSLFLNKGYKIPEGFVILGKNINNINNSDIKKINKKLGDNFAIRSTAKNEDSILNSQAGINLSILPSNIKNIKKDIMSVLKSYKSKNEVNEIVLLQKIINPKLAGVMFSKNPNQGGTILIEFCEGLSEDLMSGKKKAYTVILNRINGKIIQSDNDLLNSYAKELYNLLKNLEKDFQYPVDVEWAIDGNGLWLIQVRYQTGLQNLYINSIEQDKDKISHLEIVDFNLNEFSMILKNISPLSASLMENNWKNDGVINQVAKMAYWKWNNKSSQNYYQYAFRQMWATSSPLFQSPNKIAWWLSKLVFNQNLSEMSEIKKDIMKKFIIYKNIDFDNLNNSEIITIWKELISFWKILQGQAFYAYLMALSSLIHTEEFLQELTLPSYDYKDYAYFSDKEYFLEKERNIEIKENLKEDLFLKLNNKINMKCSNTERKNIIFSRELIILRETSKYDALKWFYLLRKCLLSMKKRLSLGNEFWNLQENEVEKLFVDKNIINLLKNRTYELNISLPEKLNADNLLNFNPLSKNNEKAMFVSTPKKIKGELTWIKDLDNINLEDEIINIKTKIIYVEYMTPELIMLCKKHNISNICSYYGSVLSHPSVLARENEITCFVGLDLSKEKFVEINCT